ncbi:WD repeat-containing protein 43 [Thoreauomyces humboldtii]|nr:WD repeat-containing protein 43 [Thoreauomyces humboldtii]
MVRPKSEQPATPSPVIAVISEATPATATPGKKAKRSRSRTPKMNRAVKAEPVVADAFEEEESPILDVAAAAKQITPSTRQPYRLCAFYTSYDRATACNYFCAVTGSVRYRVRVWDTRGRDVLPIFDRIAPKGNTATASAVAFGSCHAARVAADVDTERADKAVAVGLSNGQVHLFGLLRRESFATLEGAHVGSVTGFVFGMDENRGYSSGSDGILVEWDLSTATKLRTFAHGSPVTALAVSSNQRHCLTAGADAIKLWDLTTGMCIKTYVGHGGFDVTVLQFGVDDEIFFSATSDDSCVHAWSTELDASDEPVSSFALERMPVQISVSSSDHLLALSKTGNVHCWSDASVPSDDERLPQGRVQMYTPDGSALPVMASMLIDLPTAPTAVQEPREIMLVLGPVGKPVFERIKYLDDETFSIDLATPLIRDREGNDPLRVAAEPVTKSAVIPAKPAFAAVSVIARASNPLFDALSDSEIVEPSKKKKIDASSDQETAEPSKKKMRVRNRKVKAEAAAKEEESAAIPSPEEASESLEPTLAERLSALNEEAEEAAAVAAAPVTPTRKYKRPSTSNLLHNVLVEAVTTRDFSALPDALRKPDPEMVSAAVARLTTQQVVPLADYLLDRLRNDVGTLLHPQDVVEWIRIVVQCHGEVVMRQERVSVPLNHLHAALEFKEEALRKLLRLSGRLDLVVSQAALRQRTGTGGGGGEVREEEEDGEPYAFDAGEGDSDDDSDDSGDSEDMYEEDFDEDEEEEEDENEGDSDEDVDGFHVVDAQAAMDAEMLC